MDCRNLGRQRFRFGLIGLIACSLQLATGACALEPPNYALIDEFITGQLEAEAIPGVAVVFLSDHQIVRERGFGVAGRTGVAMDEYTPVALGSLSKSFTAIAIMQLVEQGQVLLDAPLIRYLPEFESAKDQRLASIKVQHLLQHRSGFSTYDGNFGQADYSQREDALDRAAARLVRAQLLAAPGERYEYSNANYQLLGLVLERIYELPFEEVIQQRILSALAMDASFVRSKAPDDPDPAEGYRFWGTVPVHFDKPTARTIVAQGGVYASAHDVALYLIDLMSPKPRLLSAETRDLLFDVADKSVESGYGLGWFVVQHESYREIFHGGSNPGFETISGFVPELGRGYVILVNAGTGFVGGNVRGTLSKVQDLAMGRTTPLVALPSSNMWIAIALVALLLGLLYLAVRWVWQLPRSAAYPVKVPRTRSYWVLHSVVLGLLGVTAYAFLVAIPKSFGIPLRGVIAFAPDIGWLLAGVGTSAFVCFVVRVLLTLREQFGQPKPPVTQ